MPVGAEGWFSCAMVTSPLLRVACAAVLASFAVTGCAPSAPTTAAPIESPPPATADATPTAEPTETPTAEPTDTPTQNAHNAGAVAAITTAEASAGGTAYELERTGNQWEVYVLVGNTVHEVRVSADGQQVGRTSTDRVEAEDRTRWSRVEVPIAQAITTALTVRQGDLVEADVGRRNGRPAWDVEINVPPRRDVYVDAVTGDILG